MFQSAKLNGLFKSVTDSHMFNRSYAVIAEQAAQNHNVRDNKIIYQVLSYALDELENDNPADVNRLESLFEDMVQGLCEKHEALCFETKMAQCGLEDREREFTSLVSGNRKGTPINFSHYSSYISELQKANASPEMVESMQEVAVCNQTLDIMKPQARIFSDQLLAYCDWRDSEHYTAFIASYADIRKNVVMAQRDLLKQERFSL